MVAAKPVALSRKYQVQYDSRLLRDPEAVWSETTEINV